MCTPISNLFILLPFLKCLLPQIASADLPVITAISDIATVPEMITAPDVCHFSDAAALPVITAAISL